MVRWVIVLVAYAGRRLSSTKLLDQKMHISQEFGSSAVMSIGCLLSLHSVAVGRRFLAHHPHLPCFHGVVSHGVLERETNRAT